MIKNVIFDLDGTISKSGIGIINAFEYSLNKMNVVYDRKNLKTYIGPPLRESFVNEVGEDRADLAVEYYRQYYFKYGMYETSMYDEIDKVVENLHKKGIKLFIATSKGKDSTIKILEYFKIDKFFDYVEGSSDKLNSKIKVLEALIKRNDLKVEESVMIGDRSYDIEASYNLGIKSIAVKYGYGFENEFKNASFIAETPIDILEILKELI